MLIIKAMPLANINADSRSVTSNNHDHQCKNKLVAINVMNRPIKNLKNVFISSS
jgi:hypothetical protein